jgi:tRNA pseudouridine13 synthase
MTQMPKELPLVTADLPGVGGRIKSQPEDFEVEEIPAYQPCGTGTYLFLWVEKRSLGAEYFTRQVAQRLGIPAGEVGMAGLKDRHAVTRQMISVPGHVEERLGHLEGDGIRVLRVSRHGNKLKPGHLHGNRFRILVRDPAPGPEERLGPLLDCLRQQGLPNFYGPQRFGRDRETLGLGLALLRDEPPVPSATGRQPNLRNPFLRKFALSAAQAGLFNDYLAQRLQDGLLRRVLPGDVMSKWPFGGLFVVTDPAREQERFDARETVSAGPIFGRKTFAAAGVAAEREAAVLAGFGLTAAAFTRFGKLVQGTRRHNLVYVDDLAATAAPEGVWLTFTLAAGSYATILLREVMKNDTAELAEETAGAP